MSYLNADSLLPPDLLREVQKYIQGSLIYIPRPESLRLGWGSKSGAREALDRRNAEIRAAKAAGRSIDELADEYALSPDGIRKVLYRNRGPLIAEIRPVDEEPAEVSA
ncbi:MAG TPA: CD3324 family protein [Spirochaetia bacterium]|nr:CD3324 family protein [Spirochaetales bacterium]HRY72062.1 CD3324 family protein [Spirochaetia bacterium]